MIRQASVVQNDKQRCHTPCVHCQLIYELAQSPDLLCSAFRHTDEWGAIGEPGHGDTYSQIENVRTGTQNGCDSNCASGMSARETRRKGAVVD